MQNKDISESDEKLAVMAFIHGGGYYLGSGNMYGPDFLLNENVIVVRLNNFTLPK